MKIYKTQFVITVLSGDEPSGHISLTNLDYQITEGDWIGEMEKLQSEEITDPKRIKAELIAIGNDGTYFDS